MGSTTLHCTVQWEAVLTLYCSLDRLTDVRVLLQGVIGPGGVQWMTAGRGIVHSEMPKVTEGNLWGFQLWINLPKKDKMCPPRFAFRKETKRPHLPLLFNKKPGPCSLFQ